MACPPLTECDPSIEEECDPETEADDPEELDEEWWELELDPELELE